MYKEYMSSGDIELIRLGVILLLNSSDDIFKESLMCSYYCWGDVEEEEIHVKGSRIILISFISIRCLMGELLQYLGEYEIYKTTKPIIYEYD